MKEKSQKVFKAKVVSSELVAEGVKKITFKTDESFVFKTGQYVWVQILDMKSPDLKGDRRAFSIFNTENTDNTLEIVARISDSGYKQNLFGLSDDEEILIHGPFGFSFVAEQEKQPENIIMIAGGVGVCPFIPNIELFNKKSFKVNSLLVYLNKNKENTPFLGLLDSFKKENIFDYKLKYEHFSWDDVKDFSENEKNIKWWIAGPQGMVDHTYKILSENGISKLDMVFENFYPTKEGSLTKEVVDAQLESDHLFAEVLQNSINHAVITNPNGVILFGNKAAEKTTGYSSYEMIGNTPRLWGGMMSKEVYLDFWKKVVSGEPYLGQIINRRKNNDIYYTIAHVSPILGKEKEIIGFIATEEDVTELIEKEKEVELSNKTLEDLNDIMLGRESRILELKEEVKRLKEKLEK